MIFFTADTHFGHENIIKFCKRPFANAGEMNEALIENWNATVRPGDVVWHLGDFGFHDNDASAKCRRLLNCRELHLVRGNHDSRRNEHLFTSVRDVYYLRHEKIRIFLSHYAHRVWPASHHGTLHLYGHSHGELPGFGRSMDVGVDACNFRPISLDEVVALLETAPIENHPEEHIVGSAAAGESTFD